MYIYIKGIYKYLHVYSDIVQKYTITSMNTKVVVQKFPSYQIQKSNNPQEEYKRHCTKIIIFQVTRSSQYSEAKNPQGEIATKLELEVNID